MKHKDVRELQLALKGALLLTAAVAISPAHAQSETQRPANLAGKGTDPRVEAVSRSHRLTSEEARRQLELADSYEQQITALTERFRENYLQSIFDYGQPFRITVIFDRDVNLPEVQQTVSSELRPFLRVKRSRLGRQEIMSTKRQILSLLAPHFPGVGTSFEFATDRFKVYLPDDANEQNAITYLDPSVRPFVTFKRGASHSLVGTGSEADDPTHSDKNAVWGGWPIRNDRYASCMGGFIGRDTLSQNFVMITAGHCTNTKAELRWSDGTFKILQDASYESYGGRYDMDQLDDGLPGGYGGGYLQSCQREEDGPSVSLPALRAVARCRLLP